MKDKILKAINFIFPYFRMCSNSLFCFFIF